MIYLRLAGGLGNQLFQLAAGILAAENLNQKLLILDKSLLLYKIKRDPIYRELLDLDSLDFLANHQHNAFASLFIERLRIGKIPYICPQRIPNRHSTLRQFFPPLPAIMDGYYQECWDSASIQHAILKISEILRFQFHNYHDAILNRDVVVHVRGGDFLGNKTFNICGESYYLYCVRSALSEGYNKFIIVSDDYRYARQIASFIKDRLSGISIACELPRPQLDDFLAIKNAKARIIGNSTFAWWASALSKNDGPTWAPSCFLLNKIKPFKFPSEVIVDFRDFA